MIEAIEKCYRIALLLVLAALVSLSCSSTSGTPKETVASTASSEDRGEDVAARFILGGWAVPEGRDAAADPFAETLKAFVLTTVDELREFLENLDLSRIRGSLESLDDVDFEEHLVLAAYYLWRPLKGDPLSLEGATLAGSEVFVGMELLKDPQGRERPFLMAPFLIAAINKEGLPGSTPLSFVFLVNGEERATRIVTLE